MTPNDTPLDRFVQAVLGDTAVATPSAPASASKSARALFEKHRGKAPEVAATRPAKIMSFARRLLIGAGFPEGEILARDEVILGDNPAARCLPESVLYWPATAARKHQTLLFELDVPGSRLLDDTLFRAALGKNRLLEDAVHRLLQTALEGFSRGGVKRQADVRRGDPDKTLILVSVPDDRSSKPEPTRLVAFSTQDAKSHSFEVFTLSDEVLQWAVDNRPLAVEHLGHLFRRHFEHLSGDKWQEAFVTGQERELARKLLQTCSVARPDPKLIQASAVALIKEIAKSFGRGTDGAKLVFSDLPRDHFIGADTEASKKADKRVFSGVSIHDARERLLGYLIYGVDSKKDAESLRKRLAEHNIFHNVLVIYPDKGAGQDHAHLELWQGTRALTGKLTKDGARFHGEGEVVNLLSRFFVVSRSEVQSSKDLAKQLALRAKYLKRVALEEMKVEATAGDPQKQPVLDLYKVFNEALARQTPDEFADAYAQTLTYGLLAARWMGRDEGTSFTAKAVGELLPSTSPFLVDLFSKLLALRRSAPRLYWLIEDLISLLNRTAVAKVFEDEERDPVIHFYEDFLDEYDPQIRKDRGVYYTPDEVVSYIVRTTHDALITRFGLPLGLADATSWKDFAKTQDIKVPKGIDAKEPFVQILDPALGTGTFLLRVIEVIHETMTAEYERRQLTEEQRKKEWQTYVHSHLLPRMNGFEIMMAPYIVSHLRLGLALRETGFVFGKADRLRVFLSNTLEMHTGTLFEKLGEHVGEEAKEADRAKKAAAISVIIGNPPYEREPAENSGNHKGGWVRSGWDGWRNGRALLEDFAEPTRNAGRGGDLKNVYNLYVYFWRWAMWRVFERHGAPGIVSFITAASYLRGPGFSGMREEMRRAAESVFIFDLEGDQRGTRITDNVFCITIPVCVGSLVLATTPERTAAAACSYRRISGTREEKLKSADKTRRFDDVAWSAGPSGWLDVLMAGASAATLESYDAWPKAIELFPWTHTGAEFQRTWPIGETEEVLKGRWNAFLSSGERAEMFSENRDRKVDQTYTPLFVGEKIQRALDKEPRNAPMPRIERFAFRSFQRSWCFADSRIGTVLKPVLWYVLGANQVFLTSLITGVIGHGPAATVANDVPDKHHFRGSYGGKDVIPLWRDAEAKTPNITASFVAALKTAYGKAPKPEDTFAYAYAILANPGYVKRFEEELQVPGPRLPITKDKALFDRGAALGRELIRWHTYGERFRDKGDTFKLAGSAEVETEIPGDAASYPERHSYDATTKTLHVGKGAIAPVEPEVMAFSVSGLVVVKSWLDYRMKKGAGKKSSPLDDIRPERWTAELTQELLELLWVLEWTLAQYPILDTWLDEVLASELFTADEIPPPTDEEKKEPKIQRGSKGTLL